MTAHTPQNCVRFASTQQAFVKPSEDAAVYRS